VWPRSGGRSQLRFGPGVVDAFFIEAIVGRNCFGSGIAVNRGSYGAISRGTSNRRTWRLRKRNEYRRTGKLGGGVHSVAVGHHQRNAATIAVLQASWGAARS
jgi:hypothetical protein